MKLVSVGGVKRALLPEAHRLILAGSLLVSKFHGPTAQILQGKNTKNLIFFQSI